MLEDMNVSTEELYQESLLYLDAVTLFAEQVLEEYVDTYSPHNEDTAASKLSRYIQEIRTLRTTVDLWSGESTDPTGKD